MNFLDDETVALAKSVGFGGKQLDLIFDWDMQESDSGYMLEQVEWWLWEKHQDLYFNVHSHYEIDFGWTWHYFNSKEDKPEGRFYNPFTARLAGVKKGLEYLSVRQQKGIDNGKV